MLRPHLLWPLLCAALGSGCVTSSAPNPTSDTDQDDTPDADAMTDAQLGAAALVLRNPADELTPEMLSDVLDVLERESWTDGHLALAIALGERAERDGQPAVAEAAYAWAGWHLDNTDPAASSWPGHAAFVGYRLDSLRASGEARQSPDHRARVGAWLTAAQQLDSLPLGENNGYAYEPGGESIAAVDETRFAGDSGLRSWHPQWVLGEIALADHDATTAVERLEAASDQADAEYVARSVLLARLVVAQTEAGDDVGAAESAAAAMGALPEDLADGTPWDAMRTAEVVVGSLMAADSELAMTALESAIADTDGSTRQGTSLRLLAAQAGHPRHLAQWATADGSTFWSAEIPTIPLALGTTIHLLFDDLNADPEWLRDHVAYTTILQRSIELTRALRADDGGDPQAMAEELEASLTFLVTELEPLALEHEAFRAGGLQQTIIDARDAAKVHHLHGGYYDGPLAAWTGGAR